MEWKATGFHLLLRWDHVDHIPLKPLENVGCYLNKGLSCSQTAWLTSWGERWTNASLSTVWRGGWQQSNVSLLFSTYGSSRTVTSGSSVLKSRVTSRSPPTPFHEVLSVCATLEICAYWFQEEESLVIKLIRPPPFAIGLWWEHIECIHLVPFMDFFWMISTWKKIKWKILF